MRPHRDETRARLAVADGVGWLSLEGPRRGLRIGERAAREICDLTAEIDDREDVRVVVVTASGDDFCCGVESPGDWEERHDWVAALAGLSRPTVAALRGEVSAEGAETALACDLRIAADDVRISFPYLRQGRLPRHGATQRLPRCCGRLVALDLLLTGRVVRAAEALRAGLITRRAPVRELQRVVAREAAALAAKGPLALRLAREAVLRGVEMPFEQGVRFEQDLYVLLQTSEDRAEGVRAFLEKRRPVFRGR